MLVGSYAFIKVLSRELFCESLFLFFGWNLIPVVGRYNCVEFVFLSKIPSKGNII